jgi:hypothetical protein
MHQFYDKSPEILGHAFNALKGMRRQLRGVNSSTAGLCVLGLSRPHPCGTLFQTIAVLVRRKE